jgi:hypothetical protein
MDVDSIRECRQFHLLQHYAVPGGNKHHHSRCHARLSSLSIDAVIAARLCNHLLPISAMHVYSTVSIPELEHWIPPLATLMFLAMRDTNRSVIRARRKSQFGRRTPF